MARRLDRILSYVGEKPWAILPAAASRMMAVLERRIAGTRLSQVDLDEAIGADRDEYDGRRAAALTRSRGGSTAIVSVYGTILGRDWEFTQASHGGTTSAEGLIKSLARLDADETVTSIVLDIDSPGGSVANLPELATQIAGMRTHVVAQVNSLAASAAYWIASQADEIAVTPSGEVGSIGVYTMHVDQREAMAAEGVSVEIIRAGENKVSANPFEELSDEARADIQRSVDEYHAMFVGAVAKGRGVSSKHVVSHFGDGKTFGAKEAVSRGMADRVATLDETVARLQGGGRSRGARGAAETVTLDEITVDLSDVAPSGFVALATITTDEAEIRERELDL